MAYNPAEQVEKNREFFSDAAIAARADAAAARKAKLEGTFEQKQAGLEKIHGTQAQREAHQREIQGTWDQNADLKRQLEGTFEQKQAGLERVHGTEEQRENAANWRADLQYGPGSVQARESGWRYGPGGLGERELDVHNRNVDASVYATESANVRHTIPQAAYSYHTEEGPGGEKSTAVYLGGKRVNQGGEADYSWVKTLKPKNEQHLTQISDLALVQPPEDKKAFYAALGKHNPDMLKALNAHHETLGIGTATQTAKTRQQLREEATTRLQAQGIEIPTSKPAAAGPAFPTAPYRNAMATPQAMESALASQPVRSHPGQTEVTSAPRMIAPTKENIRVMTPNELAAHQTLLNETAAPSSAMAAPAAVPTAAKPAQPITMPIPARYVNAPGNEYHSAGPATRMLDPAYQMNAGGLPKPQYGPNPMALVARTHTGVDPNVIGPDIQETAMAAETGVSSPSAPSPVAGPSVGERIANDISRRYGSPRTPLIDLAPIRSATPTISPTPRRRQQQPTNRQFSLVY